MVFNTCFINKEAKEDGLRARVSHTRVSWTAAILRKIPDWLNAVTRALLQIVTDSDFFACYLTRGR